MQLLNMEANYDAAESGVSSEYCEEPLSRVLSRDMALISVVFW